jgi:hypothetical protein
MCGCNKPNPPPPDLPGPTQSPLGGQRPMPPAPPPGSERPQNG